MPSQFYALTWNQYQLMLQGYFDKIEREKDQMRWAVWHIMAPHVKKMPSMENLLPLSTDKIETPEEMAKRIKDRMLKALNNGK